MPWLVGKSLCSLRQPGEAEVKERDRHPNLRRDVGESRQAGAARERDNRDHGHTAEDTYPPWQRPLVKAYSGNGSSCNGHAEPADVGTKVVENVVDVRAHLVVGATVHSIRMLQSPPAAGPCPPPARSWGSPDVARPAPVGNGCGGRIRPPRPAGIQPRHFWGSASTCLAEATGSASCRCVRSCRGRRWWLPIACQAR